MGTRSAGPAGPDPERRPEAPGEERERWLTPGVLGVGSASMLSDTGHEMVTSLLPSFVTAGLHGGPAVLGAIDGVADALTGLSKLAGGPLAAEPSRRGRLASGGYLGTAVATAAIGLATAVWQVAVLRALAWVSRGVRSPARDMLLTDLAPAKAYGRAFGLERAGDNLGAILGPLLAAALVAGLGVRQVILLSFIPGVLAAAAIVVAAREARRTLTTARSRRTLSLRLGALRRAGVVRLLAPIACFEIGNLATTLLILRATDMLGGLPGVSVAGATSMAILGYAAHNAAASVAALAGGNVIDRAGPRTVFATGAGCFVLAYGLFGFVSGLAGALAAFVLAGVGIGLAETSESATVALGLDAELRPHAFGVLGLAQSFGDLGATLVAGILWSLFSPAVAFSYAAVWMMAAAVATVLLRGRGPGAE